MTARYRSATSPPQGGGGLSHLRACVCVCGYVYMWCLCVLWDVRLKTEEVLMHLTGLDACQQC